MSILFAINRFQLFSNGSRQNIERRDQNGSCNREKTVIFNGEKILPGLCTPLSVILQVEGDDYGAD